MGNIRDIRCTDQDRTSLLMVLSESYAAGALSEEEFERRNVEALAAVHVANLQALIADLPTLDPFSEEAKLHAAAHRQLDSGYKRTMNNWTEAATMLGVLFGASGLMTVAVTVAAGNLLASTIILGVMLLVTIVFFVSWICCMNSMVYDVVYCFRKAAGKDQRSDYYDW